MSFSFRSESVGSEISSNLINFLVSYPNTSVNEATGRDKFSNVRSQSMSEISLISLDFVSFPSLEASIQVREYQAVFVSVMQEPCLMIAC